MGTSPKLQIQPEIHLQPGAGETSADHRLYLRKRVIKPLPIELLPGKGVWLHDIGEGGLSVSGTSRLQLGANTYLNFQFPEASTLIDAAGEVAWCDDSGRAGVRFTRIKPDSTAALKRWLKNDANPTAAGATVAAPILGQPAQDREQSLVEIELLRTLIATQKLDKPSALSMIVELMSELTRASGAAIALLEGADVICRARVGNAPDVGVKLSLDSKLSGECFLTGNIVQLNDSENDPRVDPEVCRALNFRSVLILPIFSAGQVIGICEVLSPLAANFQGGDVLALSALAEVVASLDAEQAIEPADGITEEPSKAMQEPSANEPIPVFDEQEAFNEIMALAAAEPQPADEEITPVQEFAELPAFEIPELPEIPELEEAAPTTVAQAPSIHMQPAWAAVPTPKSQSKTKAKQDISTTLIVIVAGVLILGTAGVVEYVQLARAKHLSPATPVAPVASTMTVPATTAPDLSGPKTGGELTPAKSADSASAKASEAKPAVKPAKSGKESAPEEVTVVAPSERQAWASSLNESAAPAAPSIASLNGSASATTIPIVANLPAASAPRLGGVVNVSNGVSGGKLIHRVAPAYPDLAKRAGVSGTVILSAMVAKDGSVTKLKLVKGSQLLAAEAIRAASQWRYSPFVLDGKPIEVATQIVMDFKR